MMPLGVVMLGFLVGLLSGATGVGGGTLLAPFMIFVLKVDPFVSVGTDLFVSAITKLLGATIHKRAGNVDMRSMVPLSAAGAAGALIGLGVLAYLKLHVEVHAPQLLLRHIIGAALCLCALAIGISSKLRAARGRFDNFVSLGAVGFVIALVTAVTSVGVGSLSVPALYFLKGRARMPAIVGTSLTYAAIVTAIGAIGQIFLRDVNYSLAALLLLGSLPGVALGSTLATRAPAALRPAVVALLAISGLRLIA